LSKSRKRAKKDKALVSAVFVLLISVIVLVVIVNYKPAVIPVSGFLSVSSVSTNAPQPTPTPKPSKPEQPKKRLYLIIDDAGHNITQLEKFLEFPGKMNIAVLPGLKYSTQAAELIHKHGKTVMLHQPMEALGGNDPGPDAIYVKMSDSEIVKTLSANLDSIPYAVGMNNHLGSAATEDEHLMDTIFKVLKKRKVFFVDSFTHAKSVCAKVAERNGISIAKRNVFLDNDKSREKIMEAINKAKEYADRHGHAVMIGHVWSSELADSMIEMYPEFIEEGYCFESASDFFILEEEGKN